MLEQITWRVCGVSILGDVKNSAGHNLEPSVLFDSALSGEGVGLG